MSETYETRLDLSEFWNGQRNIKLLDANLLACPGHEKLLAQLAESSAYVDFTQGLDCRLLTEDNIAAINRIRLKDIHFAWDSMRETGAILEKLRLYAALAKRRPHGKYETVLSYAEIKALCAGNPLIRLKMDLDIDVARLKVLKAGHQSKQFRLEDDVLKHFPEEIERNKGFVKGFEADMETLSKHPHPKEGFAGITIKGDTLTDKANAGAALIAACKDISSIDPTEIGSYRGFTMALSVENFGKDYILTLKGQMTHRVTLGNDPIGNFTRMDNILNGMAGRLDNVKTSLENLRRQMADAKAEIGKPFPQEAELMEKSARLAELNVELNIDEETGSREQSRCPVEKSARPSVLARLKEPLLPQDKTVEDRARKLNQER